jgi:hypothetical protein
VDAQPAAREAADARQEVRLHAPELAEIAAVHLATEDRIGLAALQHRRDRGANVGELLLCDLQLSGHAAGGRNEKHRHPCAPVRSAGCRCQTAARLCVAAGVNVSPLTRKNCS